MSVTLTPSLALYAENGSDKLDLAAAYAGILENIAANTISGAWKNTELSGNVVAGGTIFATRLVNARSVAYGTARAEGKAAKVKGKRVPVNIDIDRENFEEVEEKDVLLSGVEGLINNRLRSQESALTRELERRFFETACSGGTAITFTATSAEGKLEELIQKVQTTQNEYVDGVERELIKVALSPAAYGEVRTYLDPMKDPSGKEFYAYHGVEVKSSTYLPDGIDMVAMVIGSVAEPLVPTRVQDVERVQNSAAWTFGLAYSLGCEAVMPDLIYYHGTAVSGAKLSVKAGSTSGTSDITVTLPLYANTDQIAGYKYKDQGTTAGSAPTYGEEATGFSALEVSDGVGTISATANHYYAVVAVDADNKVLTGAVTEKVTSSMIGS